MQDDHTHPSRAVFSWNGTALNVYSIAFLVAAPFLTAAMILANNEAAIFFLWIIVLGLMALAAFEKPLFSYDAQTQTFEAHDGRKIALSQIEAIEMDAREIFFIPKSHHDLGMYFKQRCWVLSPRSELAAAAQRFGWPLKDISTPFSRTLYTLLP
jgi:hypothetical protein